MIVVYTLLIVVLGDGGATSYAKTYPSQQACEAADAAAHEAAQTALFVLDVGTLCVKSEFSPLIKPRA
jgi:hypothetical protein